MSEIKESCRIHNKNSQVYKQKYDELHQIHQVTLFSYINICESDAIIKD